MPNLSEVSWYVKLVSDCRKLGFKGIVATKWAIGRRILKDYSKFGKSRYGSRRMEHLALDLDMGKTDLYNCVQFARLVKAKPEFSDRSENVSWKEITHKYLPKPKPQASKTPPLPVDKYQVIYADPPWRYEFSETVSLNPRSNFKPMQVLFLSRYTPLAYQKPCFLVLECNWNVTRM